MICGIASHFAQHNEQENIFVKKQKRLQFLEPLNFNYNQPENQRRTLEVTVAVACPTLVLIFPAGQLSLRP